MQLRPKIKILRKAEERQKNRGKRAFLCAALVDSNEKEFNRLLIGTELGLLAVRISTHLQ